MSGAAGGGDPRGRAPWPAGLLVRLASYMAPQRERAAWRAKWASGLRSWEVLMERGEITYHDRVQTARFIRGALVEAFWLRFSREALRRSARGPALPLVAGVAALIVLAAFTHGYRSVRSLFLPLPFNSDASLVAVRYSGAVNEPAGAPPRAVSLWRAKSRLLEDIAGYERERGSTHVRVTTNFFSMIGVRASLGRTLQPGDHDSVVLSAAAWRSLFGKDPAVLGRTVEIDGERYRVVGVLPEVFWAISPLADAWTPLELEPEPGPDVPFLIGAVGRMAPGANIQGVREELFDAAKQAGYFLPRLPEVAPFKAIASRPLLPGLFMFGFALVAGVAVVALGGRSHYGSGWKYWGYLALKLAMFPAFCWILWMELETLILAGAPQSVPRSFVAGFVVTPAFVFGCAFTVWWSFADQRRRCPTCLQLLAMPVTMGSWGSVLDPAMTESLCDSGHGTLYQPESVEGLPDRWTALDPSWSDFFESKK